MNVRHRPLLGLSVAMALMGGAVVWAVAAQLTAGPNDGRGGLNEFVGVTPTPSVIPATTDLAKAIANLQTGAPRVSETIAIWLSSDTRLATLSIRSTRQNCSDSGSRGVNLCTALGLQPGTMVDRYQPKQGAAGAEHTIESLQPVISQLLAGRSPRPLFLAHSGFDAFMLGIAIDPRDPVDWVGGVDSGSAPTVAIYLTINAEGIVTDINDRARSAPPLEPIRAKLRAGEPWVLDAATAEFRDWDSAIHDSIERDRKDP